MVTLFFLFVEFYQFPLWTYKVWEKLVWDVFVQVQVLFQIKINTFSIIAIYWLLQLSQPV